MHDPRDLYDLLLEQPERVRIGEHQSRHLVVHELLERAHVDQASGVRGHRHGLEPGQAHARGVRPVRGVGDDHLRPAAATLGVVGPHDQQAGHLAAGARRWLQRRPRHPGDLAERLLQAPEQLQGTLRRPVGLQRMQALEPRERRHRLGDLGVVLHGARAERIEPGVQSVVHLRQTRVVADQVDLGHLGETGRRAAPIAVREARLRDVERREAVGRPSAPGSIGDRAGPFGRSLSADRGADHDSTCRNASESRSISASRTSLRDRDRQGVTVRVTRAARRPGSLARAARRARRRPDGAAGA